MKIQIVIEESSEITVDIGNVKIDPNKNIFDISQKAKNIIDQTIEKMINEKRLKPFTSWRYSKIPGPGIPPFDKYPIISY